MWALARQQRIPRVERCVVVLTWFAAGRGRRDADGLGPMVKACLDGMTAAGVLEDDDSTRVSAVVLRVVTRVRPARIELVLLCGAAVDGLTELLAA